MNQEFNRPSEQSLPPNPTPPKRNNTWIYITIIALLLISNIVLFFNRSKVVEQKEDAEIQFASSDSSRRAVETEYNAALVRLDELVSKNAQMDSMLNDRDSEVAKLKKQIDAIVRDKNASSADLGRAKRLIATLNSKVRTYEERIAELEQENTELTESNVSLARERDTAVSQSTALAQKVKLGAVLHASNIRMTPIDLRRGGRKIKETEKASKVDVLRINFDIDENRIAESGSKEIFLRISGPDGNVLSNAAYGSGVTTAADGQSLNYTLLKQIELLKNQPVRDVIVDWNQESDYKRGAYNIQLFHEGYKIGEGRVFLK
ncbi:MAG: hypothetical protein K0R82_711 [Flavipsychrobacter sp.]|jgi:hypothetical protein|nr:hypothetical protein [Flavipsychrobacter sp.]